MSIRFRILTPMVIISILTASIILFSNVVQFSAFVDNYIQEELERAVLKTADEIELLEAKAYTAALYYANDNELIKAIEEGNQAAVLKRTEELFAQTELESLTVINKDAIVIARGHNLQLYGDSAANIPVAIDALKGNFQLGAERGISTSISVRCAYPIYNEQGGLIGALFAGDRLDTNTFVDRLKLFTGCEISVFVNDVCVATTLLNPDGQRATGDIVPGYIEEALASDGELSRYTRFMGNEIMKRHTPVYGRGGKVVGIVSVGKYLDEKHSMVKSFIATGFLLCVIFIVVICVLILFVSSQIAEPINRRIDKARYDELTGLFNRRSLEEHMKILMKTLSRSGGVLSVMLIDIDFFKNYNDTYGHIKGDECLKAVASVLTQTLSREDDFVARYGGEEFVAVLPNTNEEGARMLAEKLLDSVRKRDITHENSDAEEYVTISIGVTTGLVSQTCKSIDFIGRADSMLYESKRNGRNMYTFAAMKQVSN